MTKAARMMLEWLLNEAGGGSYEETPITHYLYDDFNGDGNLIDHDPDTEWYWDNWQQGGHTGVAWVKSGTGTVANTDYPTAGEGTRTYLCWIHVATSDPYILCTITTPASGTAWRGGVIFRFINGTNYWVYRLNAASNLMEIVEVTNGTEAVRASAAFTITANTSYVLEVEAVGTAINCECNGTSVSWTSSNKQGGMGVGLYERVQLNGGHPLFRDIIVDNSPTAGATATRLFYAPASASILTEWDSQADSGGGVSDWFNGTVWRMSIDTTLGTSGARLQFQCDVDGQRPVKEANDAIKNLPDRGWATWYMFIPTVMERTGNFWLIAQMKQRDFEGTSYPTITVNLGWNGSEMVTEINNNIDTDGSYNEALPDLSTVNYAVPAGQWVRFDYYYHWHPTAGRIRLFVDNVERYDIGGIRTALSLPAENWFNFKYNRVFTIAHYSDGIDPDVSSVYFDNVSFNMGDRLADNYPVDDPV